MSAVELATAYVTIAASAEDLAPSFARGFKAVEKVADESGRRMGKSLTDQMGKATKADVDGARAAYEQASKKVAATVDQQASKVEAARRKEEIAQAKVTEALARYDAKSSQVLSAQDRLAMASQKVEAAQREQESATARANRELDETASHLHQTEKAAERAAGPFSRLGDRIKSAMHGDFKGAFRGIEREGQEAANELESDFRRAGADAAHGFGSSFKSGFGGAIAGIGAYMGADQLFDFGKFAVGSAADLEQSIGGVQTVFKSSADQMLKWSNAADQSLGLTANEYNEFAARLGASLKNGGMSMDELGVKTNDLIAMGSDLASLYGGTTAEAVDALSAALRGEMDPIERYGISLNDAALTQEGLAMGITKTGGSFTNQQKQLIVMSLLQKQASDATGNFAREQDTASNVAQRLTAKLKEMATEAGQNLTPVLAAAGAWLLDKGIPALEGFGSSIGNVGKLLASGDFTGGIFGLEEDSPVIGALFTIREAAISLWEKALVPLGGFIRDNLVPILTGLASSGIVAGISALVGAIGAAVTAAGGFGAVLAGVLAPLASAPVLIGAAVGALTWFFTATETGRGVLEGIVGVLEGVWNAVQLVATGDFKGGIFGLEEDNPIVGALLSVHDTIVSVGTAVQENLVDGWAAVQDAWSAGDGGDNPFLQVLVKVKDIGEGAWSALVDGVDRVKGAFASLGGSGSDGLGQFMSALSWIGEQLGGYFSGIWGLLSGIGSFVAQVVSGVILPALLDLWGILSGTIIPIVVKLFSEYIGPALAAIGAAVLWLYGNVLGPTLSAIGWLLTNVLGPAFTWLYATVISPVINAIGAVISFVFNSIVFPVLDAVKWVLVEGLPVAAQFLWSVMTTVWGGIQSAIAVVGTWITGTLVPALQAAWTAISTAALWLWQSVIVPVWEGIKVAVVMAAAVIMTIVQGLVWLWQSVLAPVALWLWQSIIQPVWAGIQAAIAVVVDWVANVAWPLLKTAWDAIAGAALWLWQSVLVPAWAGIQTAISAVVAWFRDVAWPVIQTVIGYVQTGFTTMKDALSFAWFWIQHNVIAPVIMWFQGTAWPMISGVIESIKTGFNVMKDGIGAAWSWVKDHAIQPVSDWLRNTLKPNVDNVTGGIKSAFDVMKDGISAAWDKVREAARAPVDFVINKVYNEGLKDNFNKVAGDLGVSTRLPPMTMPKGFARGGILPGFSRERDGDDQLVPMRRGEGVLVSEGLRDTASRAAFLAANAAARRGVSFAQYMGGGFAAGGIVPGFAGGGILDKVKRTAGGIWDWVADGADLVTEVLGDPAGALKKLIQGSVDLIPGSGIWKDAAKAIPTKIIDGISSMIGSAAQAVPDMAPGAGAAAGFSSGRGGSLGAAEALAVRMGLRITSRGRRGARTAQNGLVSLHALGRAIDVAGPNMMGYFNAIDASMSPTELLYSPAGGRNKHRSGRRGPNTGATLRNHFSHVHVGFAGGGIVGDGFSRAMEKHVGFAAGGLVKGSVYDTGGLLPSGEVAMNLSGRPEVVLNPAESRAYLAGQQAAGRGGGDVQVVVHTRESEDPYLFAQRVSEAIELTPFAVGRAG